MNVCIKSFRDPRGVLLGDPSKIKSVWGILYDKKTLVKVLMSFYEDRKEEEEEEEEEDVDVKEEENKCVYV